jgi:cysteine desulfurase
MGTLPTKSKRNRYFTVRKNLGGLLQFPIYLDHHSTTPVDPRVLEGMLPFFKQEFGNAASRSHCFGWKAEAAVEKARARVARLLGCHSKEVVFTSGATESNNFALRGIARAYKTRGKHMITSVIEHKCILATMDYLEAHEGIEVTRLGVDETGRIRISDLEQAIRPDTLLVSIMAANNETGTIQPMKEIGEICRARNVLFHTDAAQAVGKIPLSVEDYKIDLLSLSAHKFYGPKGVGAVYVRRKDPRVEPEPLLFGGGQENGFRSGTLNVPGIVGLGLAAEVAQEELEEERERILRLREQLWEGLKARLGTVYLNGHPEDRMPQSLNVSFPHVESDALVSNLRNIAISSTSACMSAASVPSYVLAAMGLPPARIHGSVRFGLGRFTTPEEMVYTIETVAEVVKKLQQSSPLYQLSQEKTQERI